MSPAGQACAGLTGHGRYDSAARARADSDFTPAQRPDSARPLRASGPAPVRSTERERQRLVNPRAACFKSIGMTRSQDSRASQAGHWPPIQHEVRGPGGGLPGWSGPGPAGATGTGRAPPVCALITALNVPAVPVRRWRALVSDGPGRPPAATYELTVQVFELY